MATAHDVAAYIRAATGGVDRLKLQKLTYYAQAWTLAWDGKPLFSERVEAWRHGPVVPPLWRAGRDVARMLVPGPGDPSALSAQEMANVDAVIDYYNAYEGWQLRAMSHDELPWRHARGDLPEDAPSTAEITQVSMLRYYSRRLGEGARGPVRVTHYGDDDEDDGAFDAVLAEQAVRWKLHLDAFADEDGPVGDVSLG